MSSLVDACAEWEEHQKSKRISQSGGDFKITHINVYDLEESIIASGLPMLSEYEETEFDWQSENLAYWLENGLLEIKRVLERKIPSQEKWTGFSENGCTVCGKTPARKMKKFNDIRYCCAHAHQMDRYGYIKVLTRYTPNEIKLDDSGEFAWVVLRDKNEDDIAMAKISCDDIVKVSKHKFNLHNAGYAKSMSAGLLHRFILPENQVDHINRDRLDCRRENLRSATINQNRHNRSKVGDGTSGIIGVSWRGDRGKWRAYITLNSQQITLGMYEDEQDAIRARLEAEVKYFREFAPQNDTAKKYGIVNPYIKEDNGRKFNLGEALKHFNRICRLANTPNGSGHANALSGIVVSMNITATIKWWEQFQRYHFKQIVSSMSTMHRLRKMALEGTLQFNSLTNPDIVKQFVRLAKDETVTDEELAYACPMGLMLTARVTTNYLQLRTQYQQRKHHKLKEWHDYCNFIENLPYAKEFIIGE